MVIFILVIIILIIVIAVVRYFNKAKEAREEIERKISNLTDFTISKSVREFMGQYQLLIDENRKKIAFITKDKTIIKEFKEILRVELIEDNQTTISRSLGGTIGGAVAGGILAGGIGSVVGGLSSKQNIKKKVSSVIVRITTKSIQDPYFEIECFKALGDNVESTDFVYINCRQQALEIVDIFRIIIDEIDNSQKIQEQVQAKTSVADELQKLANLKNEGIITEDEFAKQKAKLFE